MGLVCIYVDMLLMWVCMCCKCVGSAKMYANWSVFMLVCYGYGYVCVVSAWVVWICMHISSI